MFFVFCFLSMTRSLNNSIQCAFQTVPSILRSNSVGLCSNSVGLWLRRQCAFQTVPSLLCSNSVGLWKRSKNQQSWTRSLKYVSVINHAPPNGSNILIKLQQTVTECLNNHPIMKIYFHKLFEITWYASSALTSTLGSQITG